MDEAEPAAGFAEFFEADAEFVNEIVSGFGSLSFAMVWQVRRSPVAETGRPS